MVSEVNGHVMYLDVKQYLATSARGTPGIKAATKVRGTTKK
jgi:hypothetical protein